MTFLVLPKLKTGESDVRPSDAAGEWEEKKSATFKNVASSLDYQAPGQTHSISSVPSMWARPLSMEMALHNSYFPIRDELIEQWQGMLAALALAEIRGFPLTAQLIELGKLQQDSEFAKSLYELIPSSDNTLYELSGKKSWEDVYVFLWAGKSVGISSPSTLVAPSEDGDWGALPWWNQQTRRLTAPQDYLNQTEKALFWRWLANLNSELGLHKGSPSARNRVVGLISDFQNSLGLTVEPQQVLSLSENFEFFGVPLNRGALDALNLPVKAEAKPSNVRVIPSLEKQGEAPDLIVIDPNIAQAWNHPPQEIWVHGKETLMSLKLEDVRSGRLTWSGIRWIESRDIFLTNLKFVNIDAALPESFLPGGEPILLNGQKVTPLLPIDSILLDYFTPADLIKRVQVQPILGEASKVRITLDLPLSGIALDKSRPQNYRIAQDFLISGDYAVRWTPTLAMEMALHNENYPNRDHLIEQWQGMLAAIALAEVRGFPIKVVWNESTLLVNEPDFEESLFKTIPFAQNAIHTPEGRKPWEGAYDFTLNGNLIGTSSLSTLVIPAVQADWEGIPWWDANSRRLTSPQAELNELERISLWRWLGHVRDECERQNQNPEAVARLLSVIEQFRKTLVGDKNPEQKLLLSDDLQFFGAALSQGPLSALDRPIKIAAKPSNVRLIPSQEKRGHVKPLILIDPKIAQAWNHPTHNIWVYGEQTLMTLDFEDLDNETLGWTAVHWIQAHDLFMPEFHFIEVEGAFPGAFLPEGIPLTFEGRKITPLLPLNPILLEYFTPEDLMKRVSLQQMPGEDPTVRLTLDLPLSGLANDESHPQNYRITQDFRLLEDYSIHEVPVLEIWPNFRATGWKEYYTFYYDAEYGDDTFQINVAQSQDPHLFPDGRGKYQITRTEEFPAYIGAQDGQRNLVGLILLKTPELVTQTGTWTVGVDFGTSFTNIYYSQKGLHNPFPMGNLHHKVTDVAIDTRNPVLFEYFIPEKFIPLHQPLPLSSVLTTRGKTAAAQGREKPLYDGRIYVPDLERFKPNEGWIETDLKWSNLVPNRLFLGHLALHVNAIAASHGIKKVQWSLSYPSAFSRGDCRRYADTWTSITQWLGTQTGVVQNSPLETDDQYFRTESLALAQYFADEEDHNLVRSTCIDMGGGTSDISIWEDNKLVHQCSVQLAGRDLCAQFLEMNPGFFIQRMEQDNQDWQGLKHDKFNVKLDVWMRRESEEWLKVKRNFVENERDFQGFLRLMSIGVSGLYYYVGKVLRALYEEGKYQHNEITPVYLGGNGSRLLNWLAIGGQFDQRSDVNLLLSRMLSCGASFSDTEEVTRLSEKPKDEAALGLVLSNTKLTGLDRRTDDPVILGEDCVIDGQEVLWYERLTDADEIQGFDIPSLVQIPKFLDDWNLAIKEFKIDGLTPMPQFSKRAGGLEEKYKDKLWKSTQRELRNTLLKMNEQLSADENDDVRMEPPFILGLKALLRVLGKEWAGKE